MELTKQLELLKQLCEIDGVSGGEEKVADWLKNHLPEDCKVRTDALGNLICEKKGKQTPKNKLLFSAHMDEVGFIITYIEESGLLRFSSMGGIDTRVVVGKPVRLESGALGVVGAKPIHLQSASDRETVLSYDQLYIDIGAKNREDVLQFAQPGDFATFRPTFIEMGSCICAKALDNRIGCLLLLDLLCQPLEYDVTVVFSAREEIGAAAGAAAFSVQPDIAVAVDTNCAADVPGVSAGKQVCALGKGAVLSFQDKGAFMDRELFALAKKLCEEKEIPYQIKNQIVGTTDTAAMSKAGSGCRVLTVAAPVRYVHSPSSMFDPRDLESCARLLRELVGALAQL